jgi:D-aminoacyl-tRNA deacylase
MRLVVQRVKKASVYIDNYSHAAINTGLLVLLGVEDGDELEDINWLVTKVCSLRIFSDSEGKMNLDIKQTNGSVLIVSQFTLYASTKKGNRPSFIRSAKPEIAIPLYEKFIHELEKLLDKPCQTGKFGANMQIELINDGPVTIILDSKTKE